MPEVSVIVPCYNQGHYLRDALESVLMQTFDAWEAIVVDDGSTDDTRAVATSFADPRIRYIEQANQGLSAARNAGIRLARGAFLAFLDADDLWMPPFLQTCLNYLQQQPDVVGVYSASRMVDDQNRVLPQRGDLSLAGAALHERLLEGGFFPCNAVLVRAATVQEAGLFDTCLQGQGTEDWDLWLRITERHSMHPVAEPLAQYRVYPASMATNTAKMHACRMSVLAKRFGPPSEELASWTGEKRRAYGFAYRTTGLAYIQQGQADQGWRFLGRAVEAYPALLQRLDTFYELACGDQPRGYRGQARLLDVEANGAEMLRRLDDLFAQASPEVAALRGTAYGNAYLALAMLSDQGGDWPTARRYLLRATRHNPRLVSASFVRRLVKVSAGKRAISLLKRLRVAADERSEARSGAAPSREGEQRMRILFISNLYPPYELGGWEQNCQETVRRLRARRHICKVLTSRFGVRGAPEDEGGIRRSLHLQANIHYYRPLDFFLQRPWQEGADRAALRQALDAFRPDVVFIWGMWNLSRRVACWAEQWMAERVAYAVAGYWLIEPDAHQAYWQRTARRRWVRAVMAPARWLALHLLAREKQSYALALEHVACVSEYVRHKLNEAGALPHGARVIHNGIDPQPFLQAAAQRQASDDLLRLVYTGGLVTHKGVHTAIEALGLLHGRGQADGLRLTLVGGGHPDYEAQLKARVEELALGDRVTFRGRVPRSEVAAVLGDHDVFLFTSVYEEPIARSVMEGMAAGLAVIGTAVGGQVEMLEDGVNALIFGPEDAAALADNILQLRRDPALRRRLADAGRQTVLERFTLDRMVDEIEQYLRDVIRSGASREWPGKDRGSDK